MRIVGPVLTGQAGTNSTQIGSDWTIGAGVGRVLSVAVTNAGPGNLTDFEVQIQNHPDAPFISLLSGSNFGTVPNLAQSVLMFISATPPNTLAAAGSAGAALNIYSASALRFKAKTNSASGAALSIYPSISNA